MEMFPALELHTPTRAHSKQFFYYCIIGLVAINSLVIFIFFRSAPIPTVEILSNKNFAHTVNGYLNYLSLGILFLGTATYILLGLSKMREVSVTSGYITIRPRYPLFSRPDVQLDKNEIDGMKIDLYVPRYGENDWNLNDLLRTLRRSNAKLGREVTFTLKGGSVSRLLMSYQSIDGLCNQMRVFGYTVAPSVEEVRKTQERVLKLEGFVYTSMYVLVAAIGILGLGAVVFALLQ